MKLKYSNHHIYLGRMIAKGGEGKIFDIDGMPNHVAKMYFSSPCHDKILKLNSMALIAKTEKSAFDILKIAAWPEDLILLNNNVCGFLMPRINSCRNISELYSPKSRKNLFPEANFKFLLHVACNISRAFTVIHKYGHVIGDVNYGSILVSSDGTIKLVDCDSFQIKHNGNIFTCDVCQPLFTPPELQIDNLRGVIRNNNHDLFGLAVILFHLLFLGRHPFAGRYLGNGEMPIEKAIKEFRFAYSPDRQSHFMEMPPATLPLDNFGKPIQDCFIKAFSANTQHCRPDAITWLNNLSYLLDNLKTCFECGHHFPIEKNICPWCEFERQTGLAIFKKVKKFASSHDIILNIDELWRLINDIPVPLDDPLLPCNKPWVMPSNLNLNDSMEFRTRKILSVCVIIIGFVSCSSIPEQGGGLVGLILFIISFFIWPRIDEDKKREAETKLSISKDKWDLLLKEWHNKASKDIFMKKKNQLIILRNQLTDLSEKERSEEQQLYLNQYLDRFRITHAYISLIGPSRTATLASYGIETAADINRDKILSIPGFGNVSANNLLEWRKSHEKNYRYNPNASIDPQVLSSFKQRWNNQKKDIIEKMSKGRDDLITISRNIPNERQRLMPLLETAWHEFKVAEAIRNSFH